jgi:SAM-dependent methyltransferase
VKWLGVLHGRYVGERRVRVLAECVASLLPANATLLDVGCGDGHVAHRIATIRADITVRGVDVLVRQHTRIPVDKFDGKHLPAADQSVDVVMVVDVLHHTDDPAALLAEAARVARKAVVIKDHLSDPVLAAVTLRFMDWVGNAPHGVRLPYNYWPRRRWKSAFAALGLTIDEWNEAIGLYPWPASWVFERRLHFLARLRPLRAVQSV